MRQRLITKRTWSREVDCLIHTLYSFEADIANGKNLRIIACCGILVSMRERKNMLAFFKRYIVSESGKGCMLIIVVCICNIIQLHYFIIIVSPRVEGIGILKRNVSLCSELNRNSGCYVSGCLAVCGRRHSVLHLPRVRLVVSHFRHLDIIGGGDERSQLFVYCSHGKLQP